MTQAQPCLRLALSNSPDCIEIVRSALDGLAAALGLDALARNDLASSVGEAAKNVVLHAYDGAEGPLEVELSVLPGAIEAVVRDHGIGIRPRVGERTQPHNGLGMPIVHMLSRRVTYTNLDGGGTEVRMELALPGLAPLSALPPLPASPPLAAVRSGSLALSLAPGPLAAAVLPRLFDALATREQAPLALRSALTSLAATLAQDAAERSLELAVAPGPQSFQVSLRAAGPALAASLGGAGAGAYALLAGAPEPGSPLTLQVPA